MGLKLKHFNPRSIQDDAIIVIIGRRRTGKSWVARDILYHKKHIPVGLAMSGTEEGNGFYADYIPDSFIFNKYDAEALQKLMSRQRKLIRGKQDSDPHAFIVLDDLAYDKKNIFGANTPLQEIFLNGRHWKLLVIVTLQYVMSMPPELRQNIDYVIVLKDNILKNLRKLHENFFGIIDQFNVFKDIMSVVTERHGALILDNTSDSNDLSKMLFWYKAKQRHFKMGHKDFWEKHRKKYNPSHALDDSSSQKTSVVVEKVK